MFKLVAANHIYLPMQIYDHGDMDYVSRVKMFMDCSISLEFMLFFFTNNLPVPTN